MTDAELFMKMRASFKDAEAFVEAAADRIEAQAAEIERLKAIINAHVRRETIFGQTGDQNDGD